MKKNTDIKNKIFSFIKFGNKDNMIDFIENGTIYFNTIEYFKKLEEHIRISREIVKVSHKLIILKGKNAEEEIKQLNNNFNYSYSLEKSMTSPDTKIIILSIKK